MLTTSLGSITTIFVGMHYEITNGVITKYYFAGASRIAMRTGSTLTYLLGDHLGSTSLTTDSTGTKISEMHYKPFGEVRSWWTSSTVTTPSYALTKYTFTGQYSYMDDPSTSAVTEGFGLMFYNARFYDPQLGRFTSADTIIPSTQGVQGWDRYAYGLNNPSRYTDPTGHESVCGQANSDPECGNLGHGPLSHPKPQKPEKEKESCKGLGCIHDDGIPGDDGVPATARPDPNWEKIAEGVAIFVVVDLLVVAPVVVGLTAFAPELEVAMILTEAWSWPLVATVVAVNVYAWDLIVAGANGD